MRNFLWKMAGFLSLGMAYVGVIVPGIPWSIFVVCAAWCFARSSPTMHTWIYSHRIFGPFLTNWETKRVFPIKAKYFMVLTMLSSLVIMWFTVPFTGVLGTGVIMGLVAIWAWKFPSSVEEYDRRIKLGERIGWIK